jgi:thiosulfate/3-mercaptopyruvate sulfurtransferase
VILRWVGVVLAVAVVGGGVARGAAANGMDVPKTELVQPAELVTMLQGADKPLVLQVGPKVMFDQGHIAGAEYGGAGGQASGLAALREKVKDLARDKVVVLYCGCCPWEKCPNIRAAYWEMRKLGFVKVKALYIAQDFGTDWVEKGYPSTGAK